MKHNKNHNNASNETRQLVPVRFEFAHPTASTVCIAGSFNHWQPDGKTLRPAGTGRWSEEIALPPGTYEYCLVVDGKWMPDPHAQETVSNPFGGKNSVLKVASPSEAFPPTDAASRSLKHASKRKTAAI